MANTKRKTWGYLIVLLFFLPVLVNAETANHSNGKVGFYGEYVPDTERIEQYGVQPTQLIPDGENIKSEGGNPPNQSVAVLPRLGDTQNIWLQIMIGSLVVLLLIYQQKNKEKNYYI